MTSMTISDLAAALPAVIERVRKGESVVVTDGGAPVATLAPPAPPAPAVPPSAAADGEEDEDGERWWRGTYAPELPKKVIPGVALPVVVLERRLPEINTSWLRPHDDDE